MTVTGHRKHPAASAALVVVVLAAAACRPADDGPPGSRTSVARPVSPPSPGTPSGSAAAGSRLLQEAEAAYRRYWLVSRSFDRQYPQRSWRTVLAEVAVDPVLSLVLAQATAQARHHISLYGTVVLRPTVTLAGSGHARVRDCQDASRAGQADAVTGRRRTVGVARNPVSATVVRDGDGRWRVSSVAFPGGSC